MKIEPILYDYEKGCEELPSDRVEETLRIGKIFARAPERDTVLMIADSRIVYDSLECMRCVLDAGLRAVFYPETSFAHLATGGISIESLARRYRAAYEVSRRMGLEICPIAVIRYIKGLGRGLMIPMVRARALFLVQMVDGVPRLAYRAEATKSLLLNEALVFDYLIGSGQKSWYGYQVDENGKVFSPHHYLAFTYNMAGRIAGALVKRNSLVRSSFIRRIHDFERRFPDKSALIQELMLLVGVEPTKTFDMILDKLLDEDKLGDHVKVEMVDE